MGIYLDRMDPEKIQTRYRVHKWLSYKGGICVASDVWMLGFNVTGLSVNRHDISTAVVYMESALEFQEHRDHLRRLLSNVDKAYVMFDNEKPYLKIKKANGWIKRLGCVLPSSNWRGCTVRRACEIGSVSIDKIATTKILINQSNRDSVRNFLSELEVNFKKNISETAKDINRNRRLQLREAARQAREEAESHKTGSNSMFGILSRMFGNNKAEAMKYLGETWRYMPHGLCDNDATMQSKINWELTEKVMKRVMEEIKKREAFCYSCDSRRREGDRDVSWASPGKACLKCSKMPEARKLARRMIKSTFMYEPLREGNIV